MNDYQLSLFNPEQDVRVIQFRESITPDLYVPSVIVDWERVEARVQELSDAVDQLNEVLCGGAAHDRADVARRISTNPDILEVIRLVMSLPNRLLFDDSRKLTSELPSTTEELLDLVALLEEIGVWRVITSEAHLESLLKTALIAADARKRRSRIMRQTAQRVRRLLGIACQEASEYLGVPLTLLSRSSDFPNIVKRKADYVISAHDTPFAVVSTVIQTGSGGRQQRDLRLTYPTLQREIETSALKLILIADGQGLKETPNPVLRELFVSVHAVMSIKQAEKGLLTEALISAQTERGKQFAPVSRIIESILMTGEAVVPDDLPVPNDAGRLAMGAFVDDRPDLALSLEAGGEKLGWSRPHFVKAALQLRIQFDEEAALNLFVELLHARIEDERDKRSDFGRCSIIATDAFPFLPEKVLLVSNKHDVDETILRWVAQEALSHDAKLAVLITSPKVSESALGRMQRLQAALARNVILISSQTLLQWSMASQHPYELFSSSVLEQSDLAKISPFVLQGRTPDRMYFGRATEEATALHTLASNSVAVIGSRRTGKTSLLHRVAKQLNSTNCSAFVLDCQTVRDWSDFESAIRHVWNVDLPCEFRPSHLFDLVDQLRHQALGRSVVILLDEVDQLLQWDISHPENKVPEAFFRACRTISQDGNAQFVFSGERTIATKLWDPHSPHWNFCRPLPLQQLDRESTEKLVLQPLQSLGIAIPEPQAFAGCIWKYTSGHPQIAQSLGDRLIRVVNERTPKERYYVLSGDIDAIAATFDFKQHYIDTYWGQSTPLEKLVTLLVVSGINIPGEIISEFHKHSITDSESRVARAVRMLELYGLLQEKGARLCLRAEWFVEAVVAYGDLTHMIEQHWTSLS